MIKLNIIVIAALVIIGLSCGRQSTDQATSDEMPSEFYDMHNARIALDYIGTYSGVLPCADCEGIITEVILVDESQFIRRTQHIGHEDMVFEESAPSYSPAPPTLSFSIKITVFPKSIALMAAA